MHSSTHTPARDAGSGWTEPARKTKAKKPAKKLAKKSTAKKSAKKKSTAKKSAKKKSAKKSAKKTPAKAPRDARLPVAFNDFVYRPGDSAAMKTVPLRAEIVDRERDVPALRREISALKREVAELNHKLDDLTTAIAGLTNRLSVDPFAGEDVVEDPFLRWLQDPAIEQYRGRHVALHATRGVVADADSLRDVIASVRAQDISLDDVCLATVPAAPF